MNEKSDDPICALVASEKTLLSEYLDSSRLLHLQPGGVNL